MAEEMDFLDDTAGTQLDGAMDGGDETPGYKVQKEGKEIDITPDGGVKKLLVKAGEGWEKPEKGDEVTVHYTGTLLDGKKFDSSLDKGEPFTFPLGEGQVIKGWDLGVKTMKKNEKAVFTITAEYAYGETGAGNDIPANATLKFEVELLAWKGVKDISGDGGVIKTVVAAAPSNNWEVPKLEDQVLVKYTATLEDGTVVAKSPEEGSEFYLKDGLLCKGLVTAVGSMKKEEKASVMLSPEYAFGEAGRPAEDGGAAVPANAGLKVELELVSWKKVEKVTDDGLVKKKVLKEGSGYEKPGEFGHVKVRYTARLADGTEVEKKGQEEGQPFEFTTCEEEVIPGLDEAVQKMQKGELSEVSVSPEYAYGSAGTTLEGGPVPPGSGLVYEVELLDLTKDKESWNLDTAGKLEEAGVKKEAGNALFKAGKYARAAKKYEKAIKYIEYDNTFSDEEKKQSKALQVTINLNLAACKLKLQDFKEATKLCEKVLEKESRNVKAHFRLAQACMGTRDYDEATVICKRALEIEPNNRDLLKELKAARLMEAEQNKKDAQLYGNMFSRLSKLEAKEAKGKGEEPAPMEVAPEADMAAGDAAPQEATIEEQSHADLAAAAA